jgi:fructoselysine-6-P-deglycase FrlB-like protein
MADRAEDFLHQFTRKLWLLDAAALQLSSIDPAARPLVADLMLGSTTFSRIAEYLAS